jgi:hypothetical protein
MANTGPLATTPNGRTTPLTWAFAATRRNATCGGLTLGLAGQLLRILPDPRALAAELPTGPAAPGAAEVAASGQAVRRRLKRARTS